MKLNISKSNNDTYYYLSQSVRIGNKVKTIKLETIGKYSELIKICNDPLKYAQDYVDTKNKELKNNETKPLHLTIDFNKEIDGDIDNKASTSLIKNIGYLYPLYIYNKLNLKPFFDKIISNTKIKYNPDDINMFLIMMRMLNPGSKRFSFENRNFLFNPPNMNEENLYRFLDLIYNHKDEYLLYLYNESSKIIERDTDILYYDCTNFYFEIENEDEDILDEDFNVIDRGFRRYGVEKNHRPAPIVEVGLFMDKSGIPLSVTVECGNKNENETLIPLEEKIDKDFNLSHFIYCSDNGLASLDNRYYNSRSNKDYVVTESIKKISDRLKETLLEDNKWKILNTDELVSFTDFKELCDKPYDKLTKDEIKLLENDIIYKTVNAERYKEETITDSKGKKEKIKKLLKEKILITFSRKYYLYQENVFNAQVERARKLIETKDPDKIKRGPNDVRRFIKNKNKYDYVIDEDLIAIERRYHGLYLLATSLLKDTPQRIIEINKGRWEIEESFRILKTDFSIRPIYVRNEERINGHMLTCYTALLIYRILEKKINTNGDIFTTTEILNTLKNLNVTDINEVCYKALYTKSRLLDKLIEFSGIDLKKKYYEYKTLNKIRKNILK